MFEALKPLPQDPILQLMQTFREDPRPDKVDLGIGVYKDDAGNTPIMAAVHEAERRLLDGETTKSYVGPAGSAGFNSAMAELILGSDSPLIRDRRMSVVQAPGGCGALRMAAEFLRRCKPDTTVWVSTPTWANHLPLLGGAGLTIREYPYLNPKTLQVEFAAMLETLEGAEAGDVVLLHGCCHNPSGADLSLAQWQEVTTLIQRKGLLPFVDMAYQGLGEGLETDAAGLRHLAGEVPEMLIAASCSKNFGLYRERTGALALVSATATITSAANSQLLSIIRSHYSMPPAHGAAIVETVLGDDRLRARWQGELTAMCERILHLRHAFAEALAPVGDFDFIARQRGMFSFLRISPEQVGRLRKEHGIYMLDSSRVNMAGLNDRVLPGVAAAIGDVLR
ncbi:amino acid aminotransferase [Marinobacter orientalis]|uniref:Aspartate/tyrosine/aromatic aminotransferase n=1 Tax=Marinobacter orientalis TaxID=1928859 RepID=A0A7Y0WTE2_9GAMM|nr:amino acid aminotransferase [Marinobacter orientalis]NMT64645.1 aspartate/tyrosine/aromatic aminotransferase [Marinobacter orientalis]TGX48320.1 aspartate/tyrosine/aromatic aminotransferase [Marinobacter orientalis]